MRVTLQDADGSSFITRMDLLGLGVSTFTSLRDNTTNYTTAAIHEDAGFGGAKDVSSYTDVELYIYTDVAAIADLDITSVQLECYYAA